jgi:hypothetical protein
MPLGRAVSRSFSLDLSKPSTACNTCPINTLDAVDDSILFVLTQP